jgi:uncharacterized membrane protein
MNVAGFLDGFVWTQAGGMQGVSGLPGAFATDILGISGDGSRAVGYSLMGGGVYHAMSWTAGGGAEDLGTITGVGSSMAYAVSADGSTISGWSNNPDPAHNTAYRLAGAGMLAMDLPAGVVTSEGDAVSADGAVIVGTGFTSTGLRRAARWDGLSATPLSVPGGRDESFARGVSGDGTVILLIADNVIPSGTTDAITYRWTQTGGAVSIGSLAGYPQTDGRAISGDGTTIVGVARPTTGDPHPFVWTASGGIRDLLTMLGSAAPAGWTSLTPTAISNDGRAIAGTGRDPAGRFEGFVISITPVACYANCDGSTSVPILNVNDFLCFQFRFANGESYANCDASTTPPVLNVNDFLCFQFRFADGCP